MCRADAAHAAPVQARGGGAAGAVLGAGLSMAGLRGGGSLMRGLQGLRAGSLHRFHPFVCGRWARCRLQRRPLSWRRGHSGGRTPKGIWEGIWGQGSLRVCWGRSGRRAPALS